MGFQELARSSPHQPCAACRMLRRRCDSNCTLAPYFPSHEIQKFAGVHKVYGASNVIKMIQMVEETKREDTVKAIVYEATARLRDPVYGSTRSIFHLQNMIEDLKGQLESTRARILELQEQTDQLLAILMNVHHPHLLSPINQPMFDDSIFSLEGDDMVYDPVTFPIECDWIL
ncbi:DUF260 domain-containing protein [Cephalotus follicularis]|uniref:DUF260 domain-containing protein n=1 Tax=Cephalotus follicularis TaxID=3775 RepID=A0A1Q3D6E6_CEPFO|nr:DUF260 domain-containing protein [Cephalotus follicularis]